MDSVIVLGAGLSGLGCALRLPGCRVFEAANHSGGQAYSHPVENFFFDQGAHICHSQDPDFLHLVGAAAGQVIEMAPSVVRNAWQGKWLTYPVQNHLHQLPLPERVRALTDLVTAHVQAKTGAPGNYGAWCQAQYGDFLTENFYRLFTAKYWRLAMEELATDWLGGRLIPSQLSRIIAGAFGEQVEEEAAFARFRYPAKGGFFGLFAPLYKGINLTCGEPAVAVDAQHKTVTFGSGRREYYEFLASSIPLPQLVAITKDVPPALNQAARQLRHTQLLCVNLVVGRPQLTDCHWFYIYDQNIEAARVSVPSNLAPSSPPLGQTVLQAELFRRDDEHFDTAVLVAQTMQQLSNILHFHPATEVLALSHFLVPNAYVIANHQRAEAALSISSWFEERDIFTMGLYGRWKYIWSDEAFRQGRQTAEAIRQRAGAAQPVRIAG